MVRESTGSSRVGVGSLVVAFFTFKAVVDLKKRESRGSIDHGHKISDKIQEKVFPLSRDRGYKYYKHCAARGRSCTSYKT